MNMWNVMDWLNFAIFFLTWATMLLLDDYVANRECGHICSTVGYYTTGLTLTLTLSLTLPLTQTQVGYYDDWRVMATARTAKVGVGLRVRVRGGESPAVLLVSE